MGRQRCQPFEVAKLFFPQHLVLALYLFSQMGIVFRGLHWRLPASLLLVVLLLVQHERFRDQEVAYLACLNVSSLASCLLYS